jgi:hypothetical protein
MISSSVAEACNNSILLLGPRGSGKLAVCFLFPHTSTTDLLKGFFSLCFLFLGFGSCHSRFVTSISRLHFCGIQFIASVNYKKLFFIIYFLILEDVTGNVCFRSEQVRLSGLLHSDDISAFKVILHNLSTL